MKLKIKIFFIAILIGVISGLGYCKVEASEITSVFSGETINRETVASLATVNEIATNSIAKQLGITSSNYKTNNGEVYWKIVDLDEGGYGDDLYCLNLAKGYGAPNGNVYESGETLIDSNGNKIVSKEYKTKYNLNAMTTADYQNYTGLSSENKNKILWILNNSLTSTEDLTTILTAASEKVEEAGWTSYVKEDMKKNNDTRTALTFEDIKMIQQIAIWHYTNPGTVFDNTISGICDLEGNQISSQGENILIDTDTYYNYIRSGLIKQAKINALYNYFIDGAENANSITTTPTLTLDNTETTVAELGEYYIVGPFSLNGTNTSLIKQITATVNKNYTLLNSSKNTIVNNDFTQVVGNNFYLQIPKSEITETTEITIDLTYTYDVRRLTLLTDISDYENTQPVVLVETEEKSSDTDTDATIELTEVLVEKIWNDNDNQDNKRPSSIVINLLADGTKIESKTVTAENNWKCTFTNLLKIKNGKTVNYTITENVVTNYTTELAGNMTNGFVITNSYTPETIAINGTKTWLDNNNQDGKRPESITINLLADGIEVKEIVLSTNSDSSFEFKNLPKYKDGKEIKYTVTEDPVENYTTTINNYHVTNSYTPETTEKTVTKIWDDNNNQDGKRAEYGVTLKANGEVYEEEVILDSRTLTYTWTNLPKYEDGEEIIYTVEETKIPLEYTPSYSEDTFTITNRYTPGKVNKKVIKIWDDQENKDGIRPQNVTVKLYKNVNGQESEVDTQILDQNNSWTYVWNELDQKENGVEIIYSVEENPVEEYTTTYSSEDYSNTDQITITNKHIPMVITGKYNVILRKTDENGDILPGSKFEINGKEYDLATGEATVLEDTDIISTDDIILTYNIKETQVPEGYVGIEDTTIYINAKVTQDGNSYKITRINGTFDGDNTHESVPVILEGNTIIISVKNNPIEKKFDLALRKFITAVNDIEYSRAPIVDTTTIASTGTAIYKHIKTPVPVQKGDIVTYTIRVYNEGELDGYADKITDYLPVNLLPIIEGIEGIDSTRYEKEIEFNSNWLWIYGDNGKTVTTTITSKLNSDTYSILTGKESIEDTKLDAYVEGSNTLDYIDVQIKCLVIESNEILTGTYLTNIAEITESQDINGISGDGSDSTLGNVDNSNLTDYKNDEALASTTESYIAGQEDDDDFEKLIVQVYDLSLRKFITNVSRNSKIVDIGASREPSVNTTTLTNKTSTTAEYSHKKDPIEVQVGDIVTYTIRVYNEGSIDGIPAEITEYIPTYLEFDPNDELNKKYGWELIDDYNNGVGILKTNYYSNTVLKAYSYQENAKLDNTANYSLGDLKVNFIVNSKASKDTIMTNTTEISKYQYADKTEASDRDSGEQWEIGILNYGINLMNSKLYENYVVTGEITQEKANEISDYVKVTMIDYKPDYTSEDYGLSAYLDSKGITGEIFIANAPEGVPEEILQEAYKVIDNRSSNAEIAAAYKDYIDRFFQSYRGVSSNKEDLTDNTYYYVGQEDDDDFEKLRIVYFDLALRKFVTKVNSTDYNNRYPEIIYNEDGSITYSHTKDPVLVTNGDIITYTIRVYNEGEVTGYATEIKDNLPEGLAFDPNNETNKLYGWEMLDSEGNVTDEAEKVVAFKTNYLKNEKIDALVETNGSKILSYKDVQIAFKVTESNLSDRILVNIAQISADSDDDVDSIPDNNIETEDDIDKEYVRVEYFDLALKKWVTATKVTLDGKTTTTKTGFNEDSNGIAKVDIVASKLKKTTVKFVYNIKVTNEGELPGYAYEIKDYIPTGLKFVAEDNKDWKEAEDGTVVTDKLKDTLLNPGESATVEIVLTWKNSSTNLAIKTNYAEISDDSADDIDSIPDNYDFTEDDMDDAQVILSIKTAGTTTYIGLILITVSILAGGVFLIKKYVLD